MAVDLEKFVKQLEDSGIIAAETLKDFIPPKANPKDAQDLARELVQKKKLTKFQASEAYQGKAKSLVLGNYVILDKIGAGGMGQVFKAEHRRMHRIVAIKMLPPAMTKDTAALARFEREVTAAAKLRHPNIVNADDADEAKGVHFLVMEYVEGRDLSALVKKDGPFPVDKAVNYVLQAARGLEFAHKSGVIHRDIKPANLLLSTEGTVKILDMGLARIESGGDVAAQAELTGTTAIMGTVDYMAPEQGVSTKNADARADIYSLGCTLHYLLIGKATYDGETVMAKMLAHHHQPIPNLCQLREEVPEQVDAVFRKMVAKKIEDRYQSMAEVVAALERCGVGRDVSFSSPQSFGLDADEGLLTFLRDIPAGTTHKPKATKTSKAAGQGGAKNKTPLLVGVGASGFLLLALGVWVIVRDGKGHEVAKVKVPAGGSVEVRPEKPTAMDANPPTNFTPGGGNKINTYNTSAFKSWEARVRFMTAEKQIEAVSKKLMELNPGFDGKVTPKIENGIVVNLSFGTREVTDISPVRALPGLVHLFCSWGSGGGKLFDLSPLEGMKLTELHCSSNQVTDLAPLKGMPLTILGCNSCGKISSLSPLAGMLLTHLDVGGAWQVSDLLPLKGMPLTTLCCQGTQVSDLSPLQDCKNLKTLLIQSTKVTPISVAALQKALPNCKIDWDDPAKSIATQPNKLWNTPAFQAWMKEVQAMPAEQQVEAVSKKLMELNPGFDGKVTDRYGKTAPMIVNGVVTNIGFDTNNVTDISPVRALVGLKVLGCNSASPTIKGKLSDLSPLQGMPLSSLYFPNMQISDLSPLQGMKLTHLHVGNTQVSDLSLLRGMPLQSLTCVNTQVSSLSPLENCKNLTELYITGTKIPPASVAALQNALPNCKIDWDDPSKSAAKKLAYLDPAFQQWVTATQALPAEQQIEAVSKKLMELNPGFDGKMIGPGFDGGGTPKIEKGVVTSLGFFTDNVTDISPVRALAGLKALGCKGNRTPKGGKLSDLSPLEGMPLTFLVCYFTQVSDLSPLKQAKLTYLHCGRTQVTDLSPLAGMPLAYLAISNTKFSDLTPLRGMPLESLWCSETRVTDLLPLKGLPLTNFHCMDAPVSDLLPLEDCKSLTHLQCAGTKVTPAAVSALQAKLPNCKIEWDGAAKANPTNANDVDSDRRVAEWILSVKNAGNSTCYAILRGTNNEVFRIQSGMALPTSPFKITGVGLAYAVIRPGDLDRLNGLTDVEQLIVNRTDISDDDLDVLRNLPRLKLLSFQGQPRITDKSVSTMAQLANLISLNLEGTSITDAGLNHLKTLTKLKGLTLLRTQVTPAGIAALQKALPNCKIDWDDPAKPKTPVPAASETK